MNLIPHTPPVTPTPKQQAIAGFVETLLGAPTRGQQPIFNKIMDELIQHREHLMRGFWLTQSIQGSDGKPPQNIAPTEIVAALRKELIARGLSPAYELKLFRFVGAFDQFLADAAEIFEQPVPTLTQPTLPYEFDAQGRIVFLAPAIPEE